MLRLRQTQEPSGVGGRVLTDVFHDSRGLQVKKREPYFSDGDPGESLFVVNNDKEIDRQTETVYDGAGRATDVIHVARGTERWRTSTEHLGDRTKVTVPDGGTGTTTITDARGRTAEVRRHHGTTPEGDYDATAYTYAKSDQIATVTDPGGYTWRYTYDLRGRKVKEDDPDAGTSTFTYDALDREVSGTDARGETVVQAYDALGRVTERRDDSAEGALRAKWVYDTKAKGLLTSSTRYVEGEAYTSEVVRYDKLNRPLWERITVPAREGELAGTYNFSRHFKADGSVGGETLPKVGGLDKEAIAYGYDDLGRPTEVKGLSRIVTGVKYSKVGKLTQREFSLGAFAGGKKTWVTYDYDLTTDRLSEASVTPQAGSGSLSKQSYDYDDIGNILRISDEPTAEGLLKDVQCFTYDHQRRLTDAWTPNADGETACEGEPSTDELGGAAPYWHSYAYDATGNRTEEVRHTDSGGIVRSYTAPAEGQGPAHGVAKVESSGGGETETSTYEYDVSGNMTRRVTGDKDQELTWDAEGELVKVKDGATETDYLYDADGDRLIRREGPVTTLYLPGTEVQWTAGDDTVEATRFYQHGGETVAVKENSGKLHWLASDHHGTGLLAVDAASGETVQRRFTAFGEERGSTGTWPSDKGFVGGTKDESTGLAQLGARMYDATLGRFISVDPILDIHDAQQMNGYAYSNNNPVSWSDPSGLLLPGGYTVRPSSGPSGRRDVDDIKRQTTQYRYYGAAIPVSHYYTPRYRQPYVPTLRKGKGLVYKKNPSYKPGYVKPKSKPKPRVDPYANTSYADPRGAALNKSKSGVGDWAVNRYTHKGGGFNWGQALDDAGLVLGVAGMFGCALCAVGAAGIAAGRATYKFFNDEEGWYWDMIAAGTFGAGRGAGYLLSRGKYYKELADWYPKGIGGSKGKVYKKSRRQNASKYRNHNKTFGPLAEWSSRVDFAYGGFNTARSIYGDVS
nr:RHS repeat-associated core domain-containing protein [Nocardiopsis mwathae]